MQELPDLAVVEVVRDEDAAQAAERDERDHRKNALWDDEVGAAGLDAGHTRRLVRDTAIPDCWEMLSARCMRRARVFSCS